LNLQYSSTSSWGAKFGLMRWLKRVGLAGVIFFTVKGLLWLGVALMTLVLVAD